jgi:hypothetical protein
VPADVTEAWSRPTDVPNPPITFPAVSTFHPVQNKSKKPESCFLNVFSAILCISSGLRYFVRGYESALWKLLQISEGTETENVSFIPV